MVGNQASSGFLGNRSKIDFLGARHYAYVFSAIMIAASIYLWVSQGDAKYGIDYRGGYEFVVRVEGQDLKTDPIRVALENEGIRDATVQSFELGSGDFSLRLGTEPGINAKQVSSKVEAAFRALVGEKFKVVRSDFVGPSIGAELLTQAAWAIALGLISILIYVAFRFEFSFGLGAVVALFHDVIVATGVYLLFGHALNGAALAATLTIVGYSVNDTIVIFDRVREEMNKRGNYVLKDVLNDSLNAMLSRTIITSFLTLAAAFSLLIFGGGAVSDLSLYLVAGVITGCYSTVYIAAPIVLAIENYRNANKTA